jgi:hypothetical protein
MCARVLRRASTRSLAAFAGEPRIDRWIAIVAETGQFADRQNSYLKIKNANFRRIAETVLRGARKKFTVSDQALRLIGTMECE